MKVLVIVDYNIVTYCRSCNKRTVTKKGEPRSNYCDECRKKFLEGQKELAAEAEKEVEDAKKKKKK